MVLAKRKEFNVFHDYHLIVVFVKHSAIHDGAHVFFVALCEKEHGFRIALWGIKQALSVKVLAHAFQDRPYSARQLGQAFSLFLLGRLLPLECSSTLDLLVSLQSHASRSTYLANSSHQIRSWGAGCRDSVRGL